MLAEYANNGAQSTEDQMQEWHKSQVFGSVFFGEAFQTEGGAH